jgi:hypothetical protein
MKVLKTAVSSRKIDDLNPDVVLFHLREVLTEYRKVLINRLILDLPTYLDYKFKKKPGKEKLDEIREKLYAIKNSSVDLTLYEPIVKEVLAQDNTFIKTELLYKEIDESIGEHLREGQIVFTATTA